LIKYEKLIALRFNLRVDYNKNYPRTKLKPAQQHQAKQRLHHPSKDLDSSKTLNTTWFNNLPLFDEDKSLMLVLFLIKYEVIPAIEL